MNKTRKMAHRKRKKDAGFKLLSLDTLISWGASVVILGAMFKILHIKGAELMIGAGLTTEALLFFVLPFKKPPKEYEWEKVYPELEEEFEGEGKRRPSAAAAGTANALDQTLQQADITPDMLDSLGSGLRSFSEKMSNVNDVADTALAADELSTNLKSASGKVENMADSFSKATQSFNTVASSSVDIKSYKEGIEKMAVNIASLNAVYEAEIASSKSGLSAMGDYFTNVQKSLADLNEVAKESNNFKNEVTQLTKNLSTLNAIYGNMLSAMNTASSMKR